MGAPTYYLGPSVKKICLACPFRATVRFRQYFIDLIKVPNADKLLVKSAGILLMTTTASRITSLTVVYSTVYSDADQRKHQSSASLAFGRDRWIPRTKGRLREKCFHLMTSSCVYKAHIVVQWWDSQWRDNMELRTNMINWITIFLFSWFFHLLLTRY